MRKKAMRTTMGRSMANLVRNISLWFCTSAWILGNNFEHYKSVLQLVQVFEFFRKYFKATGKTVKELVAMM